MAHNWTINGKLTVTPAPQRTELLAPPVARALLALPDAAAIGVAAIDAMLADTAQFCEFYDVPLSASANCVVVAGKRGGEVRYAACLALATTRVNVNTVVRQHLNARKASFAPMDAAVEMTGMEYGGITPIGLPSDWSILVDLKVAAEPELVIGGGSRGAKLLVSGETLAKLPGAQVVDGLASSI
ncbi:YbaK/EbsC family protein [Stackebrandtia nassauensis]|uniref:YbaK/prolyl-tRNA synthetase associated region n=1 Tax=Stackebrandtia nassauensis (strain DSM 44728 / CIP 108903 / NRRL B-16338 / NBRC 102104 / LLR-40K-21) TaxID=446470 RepID=D3Q3S2_STANL|nr:YbaK/EbsC family protein [Stackebrandtia nassauensis]ADD43989.1 YbaK/prolyl-tRNA synthetase associated region [Stackebrandtia nassauensis DSM 44728]